MNAKCYRTVFNAVRGMLVAVEETASSTGKGRNAGACAQGAVGVAVSVARFTVLPVVFGAWCALGVPAAVHAQVVAAPGSGAQVVQTANGLQQVNIARPNGSGVSLNTYSQFNVPAAGNILNNSSTITQTQQAGYINGNPNLLPGGSARIIVNQVTSTSPTTIQGYTEVAGQRAEVVIANPNGITVSGGGFINTSRATLTTGIPVFGGSGSLDAYRVTGGQITIQGGGLNAANVDQVDLIARAVQANAAVYANQLNVIAGANQVDRNTLAATPIAGDGGAPSVGIDVSALGGMYANKILLASTENGVGVSLKGVTAAQAGDLTLTSGGQLILAGTTSATGNLNASARGDVTNSGATYGSGPVSLSTDGTLTNAGALASQQGLSVDAGAVNSTGSLGAGVAQSGAVAQAADLKVTTTGALSATGTNAAGGNATFQGAGVSLARSQTSVNGNLALNSSGNVDLTGASTHAGGAVNANAAGAFVNDAGRLSGNGPVQVTAGSVSNAGGQIVSQAALGVQSTGAVNNTQGTVQAAGALAVSGSTIDNTAGRLVSLNADGLTVNAATSITNAAGTTADGAQGGVIGGNGAATITAQTLTNRGQISAATDAALNAATLDNSNGSVKAGRTLAANVTGAVNNQHGTLSADTTNVSAGSIDNSAGTIEGNQLGLTTTGNLSNRNGAINQVSQADTTLQVGGALDNTGGTIAANAQNLTVNAQALTNDGGKLQHAGSGAFSVTTTGALSNVGGQVRTNGTLSAKAGSVDNTSGSVIAQGAQTLTVAGALNNTNGTVHAGDSLKVQAGGALTNVGGNVEANSAHSTLSVSSASLDNTSGRVVNVGDGVTTVAVQQTLLNANPTNVPGQGLIGGNGALNITAGALQNHGTLSAKGDQTLNAQSFDNSNGTALASGALSATIAGIVNNNQGTLSANSTTLTAASVDNTTGKIEGNQLALTTTGNLVNRGGSINQYSQADTNIKVGGTLDSTNGLIAANALNLSVSAQAMTNDGGKLLHAGTGTFTLDSQGTLSNVAGQVQTNGILSAAAASLDNSSGLLAAQGAQTVTTQGALNNTNGTMRSGDALKVEAGDALTNVGGDIEANGVHSTLSVSARTLDNTSGRIVNVGDGAAAISVQQTLLNANPTNASGQGLIGSNGALGVTAGALQNHGTLSAKGDQVLTAQSFDNSNGSTLASGTLTATIAGALNNASGTLSANSTTLTAGATDNTAGKIEGNQLALTTTGNLVNRGGSINQYSQVDTTLKVGGTLDNTNGTIAANAQNLAVSANAITNDSGKLQHAGTGAITVASNAAFSNVGGQVQTNGALSIQSAALDNTSGLIAAHGAETVSSTGALNNTNGTLHAGGSSRVRAGGALTNVGGNIEADAAHGTLSVSAASLDNTSGRVVNVGDGTTTVAVQQALVNASSNNTAGRGFIGGNGDLDVTAGSLQNHGALTAKGNETLTTQSFDNSNGSAAANGALTANVAGALVNHQGSLSSGTTTINAATLDNTAGKLEGNQLSLSTTGDLVNRGGTLAQYSQTDTDLKVGGTLDNINGSIAANAHNLSINANAITNDGGKLQHAGAGTLTMDSNGALSNVGGQVQTNGALSTHAQSIDNTSGLIAAQGTETVFTTVALNNTNGTLHAGGNSQVQAGGALTNVGGNIEASSAHGSLSVSANSLDNTSGRVVNVGDGATTVAVQQALLNANPASTAGRGVIGGNGDLAVSAGTLQNHGTLTAKGNETLTTQSFDNSSGSARAGGALTANVGDALTNQNGLLSGNATSLSAASLDNSSGHIEGNQLGIVTTGDLVNRGGILAQYDRTDTTLKAGGSLDNTGGTIAVNADNLTLSGRNVHNDGGKVQHAGTGTLSVSAQAALTNTNHGQIQTNGALTTQSATLDNTNGSAAALGAASVSTTGDLTNKQGTLYGQSSLTLASGGQLDNTAGSAQTQGNLSATASGAIGNAGGQITANGPHGTMTVSGARVDNAAGRLVNAGDGATAINATNSINNAGGSMGGTGDVTLNSQTLTNTANAKLVASGALTLNTTAQINNQGGLIYGGQGLTLNQTGATLTNNNGSMQGGKDLSLAVASMTNTGGNVRANHDVGVQGAVSGDGEMTAGRNLTLKVAGDYTNGANNHLRADGDMLVSATGTLTNSGTLGAAGNTTASGANVVNTATGDITGANTSVTASNAISNAGRIEGNGVQTQSATLANTGTVIGNHVQVQAADITNSGAAAVMAAVQQLNVYATNSVSNLDGATLYSFGNMQIARDGARDPATGLLTNQIGTLTNRSATIDAGGDIDIAARAVNNTRTSIVTAPGTPQSVTQTLSTWYRNGVVDWTGFNTLPITATVDKSTVTNLDTTAKSLTLTKPATESYPDPDALRQCGREDIECRQNVPQLSRNITANAAQWYQSIQDNGSTYTITFRPDWDPTKNIQPDQVRVRYDLGIDSRDYHELSRTTTTTTTTDQLISASDPARIRAAGAIRVNANGGSILNGSSTMAAGGNLIRSAVGGTVTDQGTVLQQSVSTTETSTFFWHAKTWGGSDTQVVPYPTTPVASTTVAALPAIATSNQAVQTTAQTINVSTVDRLGQTVTGSGLTGGGASGATVGSAGNGVAGAGTVAGSAGSTVGSAGSGIANTGTVTGGAADMVASAGNGAANAGTVTGNSAGAVGSAGKGAASAAAVSGTATSAVGATTGSTHAYQTLGTANGGIPNLTLPLNGLFHVQPAPSATYLVATDPRFTQYTKFISSDYMLSALNLNPQTTEKRLGDGFYEEKLVRDQITQLTGRVFLAGQTDQLDEYRTLMDSGVKYAKAFSLTPGIGLSDAQMAQLTTDMVWLVSQDVTLPDGSHQSVLVPKLYLAQAHTVDLASTGALVAGNTVQLNASGDVNSSGRIVGDVATQVLGNNILNQGVLGGNGSQTLVQAVQDVHNLGGTITGQDVGVVAGRDVINSSQLISNLNTVGPNNYTAGATGVGSVGTISATNNATVLAGRDITMLGGSVGAGNTASLVAGRDLTLGTVQIGTTQDAVSRGGLSYSHDQTTTNVGSIVAAGQNVVAVAGRDATLTSSIIQAGNNATVAAAGNVTATAAINTHTHSEGSLGGDAQYKQSSYDEKASGSTIQAGNNATLGAGQTQSVNQVLQADGLATVASQGPGNVSVLGSSLSTDKGTAKLVATGDVTVGAVNTQHTSDRWSEDKHSGFLSSTSTKTIDSTKRTDVVGSTVSADSLAVSAGRDINVNGSSIAATNDATLVAKRDINITAATASSSESHFREEKTSGLMGSGGIGFTIGSRKQSEDDRNTQTTAVASTVGSTNGNVSLTAGNHYQQTGSNVIAVQGDVDIQAKKVDITEARETSHSSQETKFEQSGLTVAVTAPLIAALQTASQMGSAASQTSDARLKLLAGGATALAGKNAMDAVKADPKAAGGLSVSVTVGGSKSQSTQTQDAETAAGSTVRAGGDVRIRATGDGKDSTLTVQGSDIQAGNNASLKADGDINLLAAKNTTDMQRGSSSMSGGVGVAVSVGSSGASFGITANASASRGDGNGHDVTWTNTHVNAGNQLTLESGGDTNIKGAVAFGKQVVADVGGNLNMASLQDTSTFHSKDQSIGGSVTVGMGASGSVSASQQKIDSDYASVKEQSGIKAGDGGFQVNVKGNTDLKGAVLASTDKAVQDGTNSLTTATLTTSEIHNHADYSASSVGIGGGYSTGGGGMMPIGGGSGSPGAGGVGTNQQGQATTGGDKVPGSNLPSSGGFSAAPPIVMGASGSSSSTTVSGISGGAIHITDGAKQQALTGKDADQTVASVNRNVSTNVDTSGSLAPIFNEKEIKTGFEITGAFIRETNTFLNNRAAESTQAQKALDAEKAKPADQQDQAKIAQLTQTLQDNATWGMGGTGRMLITALTAGAGANVTGGMGQLAQNATIAYLQELGTQQVKQMADSLGSEGARAALHAIVGCAGAAASSQSCGSGAMGAAASSVIGSLLGPTDGMTPDEKQARENLVRSLVAGVAGATGLNSATATNAATIEVENNHALPKPAIVGVDLVRKYCGATQPCSDKQVSDLLRAQNALNSAAGKNATVAVLLMGGPTLVTAGLALAALAPEMLSIALANPTAAVQAGIISAETAAAIMTNSVAPSVVLEGAAGKAVQRGTTAIGRAAEEGGAAGGSAANARLPNDLLPNSSTLVLTETEARSLGGQNKGLIYVTETPRGGSAAQDFQAGTNGAFSDLATGKPAVPALRYDNPNANGVNYVKFDGVEEAADGTKVLLIDAKTKLAIWSDATQQSTLSTLDRVRSALQQNPGYKVVYEFPNTKTASLARDFIIENGFGNIVSVRVRNP